MSRDRVDLGFAVGKMRDSPQDLEVTLWTSRVSNVMR